MTFSKLRAVAKLAYNVQGFALGQSEITNYRTLGSVAANNFQKPHCRRGLAQNPLLAAVILVIGVTTAWSHILSINQGEYCWSRRRLLSIGKFNQRKLLLEIIAANVQGFALGQSEITNYRTLGSVAANNFQKPHCRHGRAQNPLLAAGFSVNFNIAFVIKLSKIEDFKNDFWKNYF